MTGSYFAAKYKAKEKPLYGPEGSAEGKVDPNTHKAELSVELLQNFCLRQRVIKHSGSGGVF